LAKTDRLTPLLLPNCTKQQKYGSHSPKILNCRQSNQDLIPAPSRQKFEPGLEAVVLKLF